MLGYGRTGSRRAEIRRNRPDAGLTVMSRLRAEGALGSMAVGALFFSCTVLILILRDNVVKYRPGQWTRHDLVSRVDFVYPDVKKLAAVRQEARDNTPRVYKLAEHDIWKAAEQEMLALPDRVKGLTTVDQLPSDLRNIIDQGALSRLQEYQSGPDRERYENDVRHFITDIRGLGKALIIIPSEQRQEDWGKPIVVEGISDSVLTAVTQTDQMRPEIEKLIAPLAAQNFTPTMYPKMLSLTLRHLGPTHVYDEAGTSEARKRAAAEVPETKGVTRFAADMKLVEVGPEGGEIKQDDWFLLKAENDAYLHALGPARWGERAGLAGIVLLMTIVAGIYVSQYQPRIVRNRARAVGIAVLMLSMLLLAELAALGSSSIYFFGVAPTILVAMILSIAYDQRFALGMASFHAVLVTLALDANLSFLAILEAGVVTCCFLLDDLRTRSKLIEIGGMTALAMISATAAAGLLEFDPLQYIARSCLYAGAAGLTDGFIVLGILPFIEKTFRITTSMTLLELADASQPLLRRLSLEAPGTYNHSLQVATLSEEAADTIGANSLLCRVAAYYHDIGKINKAEYFVENQVDGQNRHINLTPNVSLLIIIGHVKDGMELAREYGLPTSIFPFIQQHHGTTLVEFFYHRACDQNSPSDQDVSETQFRYPGPKPKTVEIAILMLADAVESACRAMSEPTASRIEMLVHEISMRRLQDGQFDECDLTMRDLEMIERSLAKTLLGIYHGRIAYPSTSATTSGTDATTQLPTIRTA
jgi:putative nucleotidyltransferase with HDIG domain